MFVSNLMSSSLKGWCRVGESVGVVLLILLGSTWRWGWFRIASEIGIKILSRGYCRVFVGALLARRLVSSWWDGRRGWRGLRLVSNLCGDFGRRADGGSRYGVTAILSWRGGHGRPEIKVGDDPSGGEVRVESTCSPEIEFVGVKTGSSEWESWRGVGKLVVISWKYWVYG